MVAAQTVVNNLGKRLQEVLKKLSDVIEKYKEQQKEKCDLHCQLGEDLCFCFKCAPAVPPPPPPPQVGCMYIHVHLYYCGLQCLHSCGMYM